MCVCEPGFLNLHVDLAFRPVLVTFVGGARLIDVLERSLLGWGSLALDTWTHHSPPKTIHHPPPLCGWVYKSEIVRKICEDGLTRAPPPRVFYAGDETKRPTMHRMNDGTYLGWWSRATLDGEGGEWWGVTLSAVTCRVFPAEEASFLSLDVI